MTPKSIIVAGGKEEIPIFTGEEQIHITADVAYSVWKYWDATHDDDFLCQYGAEILVETGRFWASRVTRQPEFDDTLHILGVVGPDEYHHSVDDNAYTNWMAKFNLDKAAWVLGYLEGKYPEEFHALQEKLQLERSEARVWGETAHRLYFPAPDRNGIIEQFRGFRGLRKVELPEHERGRAPVSRLFNWREISAVQLIKQADVLMIPFLFPNAFPKEIVAANYRFYEPITDHGSSLSICVYAAVAAQIGLAHESRRYWEKGLYFDLENAMSNTGLGIHTAAIGGAWQALLFHLLGVELTADGPKLESSSGTKLPFANEIVFGLTFRGRRYRFQTRGAGRQAL